MRMIEEVQPLILYNKKRIIHAPVNETDKRKGAAILLLAPNMDTAISMTMLPYIYNQNHYISYFIDRDVSAYINAIGTDNVDFDEREASKLSESFIYSMTSSVKFEFDSSVSVLQHRYMANIYNKDVASKIINRFALRNKPKKIYVKIYKSLDELQKAAPEYIKNTYGEQNLFSFTTESTIHILSFVAYDSEYMAAPYDIYLTNELMFCLISFANPLLDDNAVRAIACVYSGRYNLIKTKYTHYSLGKIDRACKIISMYKATDNSGLIINKYIKTADPMVLYRYSKSLREDALTVKERDNIDDKDFGIPSKRKYPLNDKSHVLAAIRMFNKCDPEDEEVLARNIINKINHFKIFDINVGKDNRFSKYYNIKETYLPDNIMSYRLNKENIYESFKDELKDVVINTNTFGFIYTDGKQLKGYYTSEIRDGKSHLNEFVVLDEGNNHLINKMLSDMINIDDVNTAYINRGSSNKHILDRNFNVIKEDYCGYHMELSNSTVFDGAIIDPAYNDVLTICNSLPKDEFDRISFDPVYRNSPFVIKRIVEYKDDNPAGFLDVYYFPSNPELAQIVIAVNSNYRGFGIADKMVKKLLNSKLQDEYNFKTYYWTAHVDNIASQNLAIKNRFIDTDTVDRLGRKVFILPVEYIGTLNESVNILLESKEKDKLFKKYLYNERIKNEREVKPLYEKVKQINPNITRTYRSIDMYKGLNLFIDLSYYHSLFLEKNNLTYQKSLDMYIDLLGRLMDNPEYKSYKNKTVFIPIDNNIWNVKEDSDLLDFKKNINPFSLIHYLIRFKIDVLRKLFKNKKVLFVHKNGYFTVDFNDIDMKNLSRFKTLINKLITSSSNMKDDEDISDSSSDKDTATALASKAVDKIENKTSIKIDTIPKASDVQQDLTHLTVIDNYKLKDKAKSSIFIINIDPDGANSSDIDNIKINIDTFIKPV